METIASPTKRRVLGSLDPNASPRPARLDAKQVSHAPNSPLKKVTVFSASPAQPEQGKRPLLFGEVVASELLHPAKKVCQEDKRRDMTVHETSADEARHYQAAVPERRQSASPEPSSLFDNSVVDTSQATTITEPDVVAVTAAAAAAVSTLSPIPRPATRPRLSREEARQKAEILKLRLGLASYKLRTGQADIPLEQLELQSAARNRLSRRSSSVGWASSRLQAQLQLQRAQLAANAANTTNSIPEGPVSGATARPSSSEAAREADVDASFSSQVHWSQGSSQEGFATGFRGQEESGGERVANVDWSQQTPRRQQQQLRVEFDEDRLTSSALRGGAASGLLSLAHARS